MTTWLVTDRVTAAVIYAYTSDTPVEWPGMEFAICNHSREPEIVGVPQVTHRVTKQQFIDLLGAAAVAGILTMAKVSIEVESWVKRLDLITPDPDGTSVDLMDSRTIAGVRAMESALVVQSIVSTGWADEVLSGYGL